MSSNKSNDDDEFRSLSQPCTTAGGDHESEAMLSIVKIVDQLVKRWNNVNHAEYLKEAAVWMSQ